VTSENLAFYEIRWKNKVQSGRPKLTLWFRHLACWIIKATNTQSEYVTLIAFQWQQYLPKHASMLTYI